MYPFEDGSAGSSRAWCYIYEMSTPNNGPVKVKVLDKIEGVQPNHRFDCHSYALGTWNTSQGSGYSFFEGSFEKVITDKGLFREITEPAKVIKQGDKPLLVNDIIVIWDSKRAMYERALHSAIITGSIKCSKDGELKSSTVVTSKNGSEPLVETDLWAMTAKYCTTGKELLSVYRHCDGKQPWQ